MPKQSLRLLASLVLVVAGLGSACSRPSTQDDGASADATATPTVPSSNGDACTDPAGDLDFGGVEVKDQTQAASLAGIDITDASATRNGDNLDVHFETAGPIGGVADPTFVVAQGYPLQPLSFELRAIGQGGTWKVLHITWPQDEKRQTLVITPTVNGNQIAFSVPLDSLPPIASVLQFGSSATGPNGSTLVIDECSSMPTPEGTVSTLTIPN